MDDGLWSMVYCPWSSHESPSNFHHNYSKHLRRRRPSLAGPYTSPRQRRYSSLEVERRSTRFRSFLQFRRLRASPFDFAKERPRSGRRRCSENRRAQPRTDQRDDRASSLRWDSAVRLLEADEQQFIFLLERLRPGEMLSTPEDDDQATNIAAGVMLNLWRPAPSDVRFIKLTDWFDGLKKLRPTFNGGTGPIPKQLIGKVEELLPRLFTESSPPMLIHGDLHHYNILSSERGWLAIDPKGVIGPPEYEVGPLLINPWGDLQKISQLTKRRIAILSERLGFSRQMIRDWALCHAVLSAWWSIQDHESGEFAIKCAEIFSEIKF